MKSNDLIKKLIQSEGVKSLAFENNCFSIYEKYKWNNIHSPYFQDLNTNKLRELDIISRTLFKKKEKKKIYPLNFYYSLNVKLCLTII